MIKLSLITLCLINSQIHAEDTAEPSSGEGSAISMSGEFSVIPNPRDEVVSGDFDSVSSHSDMIQTDASQGGDSGTSGGDGDNDGFYDNSNKDTDPNRDPYEWWTEASVKYNFDYLNSFNAS